jgi:hypothetical protein
MNFSKRDKDIDMKTKLVKSLNDLVTTDRDKRVTDGLLALIIVGVILIIGGAIASGFKGA